MGNLAAWGWARDFQVFKERRGYSQHIQGGVIVIRFRLKGCKKCGGDLALDEGDWICLQCGTYYYVHLYQRVDHPSNRDSERRLYPDKSVLVAPIALGPQHTMVTTALAAVFLPVGAVSK